MDWLIKLDSAFKQNQRPARPCPICYKIVRRLHYWYILFDNGKVEMAKKVDKKNPEEIRKSDSHMYDGENKVDNKSDNKEVEIQSLVHTDLIKTYLIIK